MPTDSLFPLETRFTLSSWANGTAVIDTLRRYHYSEVLRWGAYDLRMLRKALKRCGRARALLACQNLYQLAKILSSRLNSVNNFFSKAVRSSSGKSIVIHSNERV